jgi:hypothetical protein
MSTEKILQFFRDQEPAFLDEPDDKLINFIGSTEKEFLQDEEFKQDFQNVLRGKMQRRFKLEPRCWLLILHWLDLE